MKLLKLIVFIFLVYFVRRFIQMYRTVKRIHDEQLIKSDPTGPHQNAGNKKSDTNTINAEYEVID